MHTRSVFHAYPNSQYHIILTHFQQMFHFISPENIRKQKVLFCFQEVENWNIGWKYVNRSYWQK